MHRTGAVPAIRPSNRSHSSEIASRRERTDSAQNGHPFAAASARLGGSVDVYRIGYIMRGPVGTEDPLPNRTWKTPRAAADTCRERLRRYDAVAERGAER
jgi:hypothetical protein